MADNTGLFGDGMMGGYGNNITAANIIRSRYRQPIAQAAMENAEPNSSIRNIPDNAFQAWLNESGQRLMNPTDTIAQGVKDFTGQSDTELASSLMGGGLGTFAGVGAKNADRAAYNIASKMKQAGVADREIHAQTGWTFGFPDGRPRFEIDDSAAKGHFTHLPPSTDRLAEQAISHPSLYQAYPDLSEISQLGLKEAKEAGSFSPTYIDDAYSGGSLLAKAPDETGIKSIGLHELQHAVQQQEGFARGGSPQNFTNKKIPSKLKDVAFSRDLNEMAISQKLQNEGLIASEGKFLSLNEPKNLAVAENLAKTDAVLAGQLAKFKDANDKLSKYPSAHTQYRNLAGEAEARLTQARMNMTQAERAASYPPSMFDVPIDQQIVRFGDGPAMSTNTNNQPLVNALRSK